MRLITKTAIFGMLLFFAVFVPATTQAANVAAAPDTAVTAPTADDSLRNLQGVATELQTQFRTSAVSDSILAALCRQADAMADHFTKLQASLQRSREVLARMPNSGEKLRRLETLAAQAAANHARLQNAIVAVLAKPATANIQTLLQVIEILLPPERHQPIGAALPNRGMHYEHLQPIGASGGQSVYGGKITLPAGIALAVTPTAADLASTQETQLTPELLEKISYLDSQPVNIFSWVRNNIDYEPYFGSIKGAALTLADQSGNDLDQASLLIALLRGAGIPCRYVYGTITVPIGQLMNWVGVCDTQTAFDLMATGAGVPIAPGYRGNELVEVTMEHVWVIAWVDYFPSRGAVQREGDCWIPLDPSYKEYIELRGRDITGNIHFNTTEYLAALNDTSPVMVYLNEADKYLRANISETATSMDASYFRMIDAHRVEILSENLAHKTARIAGTYDEIPDVLRHKWRFQVGGIDHTATLAEIGRHRVALTYVPASEADQQIIAEYGGIYGAPPYLVSFRPQLEIQGVATATGQPIGSGEDHVFRMEYIYPGNEILDAIENPVTAGAYYGIGIAGKKVSTDVLVKSADVFIAMVDQLNIQDTQAMVAVDDNMMKELLYLSAISYFYQLNAGEDLLTGIMQIEKLKQPSEAMCGFDVGVDYSFGVPSDIYPLGFFVDVDRNVYSPFAVDGDHNKTREFMVVAGYSSSLLEHKLFEQRYGLQAVSTIRALQLANVQGIPVYMVTKDNCAALLAQLQVNEALKTEIRNLVNQNLEVTLPEHNLQVEDWNGIGYLVMNPLNGAGGYMISGGIAGATVIVKLPGSDDHAAKPPADLGTLYMSYIKRGSFIYGPSWLVGDIWLHRDNALFSIKSAIVVAHNTNYITICGAAADFYHKPWSAESTAKYNMMRAFALGGIISFLGHTAAPPHPEVFMAYAEVSPTVPTVPVPTTVFIERDLTKIVGYELVYFGTCATASLPLFKSPPFNGNKSVVGYDGLVNMLYNGPALWTFWKYMASGEPGSAAFLATHWLDLDFYPYLWSGSPSYNGAGNITLVD